MTRLRALSRGEVGAWVVRHEQHRALTREGVKAVEVERPVYETHQVDRDERLRARRALPEAEVRLLDLEADLEAARPAFTETQRVRRADFVAQADRDSARELAELVRLTDALAQKREVFASACRDRDQAYFATSGGVFQMQRYSDLAFPALAGAPGEPSMWARFKALLSDTR